MAKLRLEIVTAERQVFADDVDMVIAPGVDGELGILPHHTPLLTTLQPGELRAKKEGQEIDLFVSGGFLEVRNNKVVVLADAAERVEEIDVARAEAARQRAADRLKARAPDADATRAEASLRRAMTRIKIVERQRRRRGGVPPT